MDHKGIEWEQSDSFPVHTGRNDIGIDRLIFGKFTDQRFLLAENFGEDAFEKDGYTVFWKEWHGRPAGAHRKTARF
ncbi:MAG: hypothetical protein ACI3VZ_02795 [Faecousia sp.]